MIKLQNVTKYFKTEGEKKYILDNVTLTIPSNTNVGILGKNGAGKSTLLRMLGGIDFPTRGAVLSNNTFSWPMGLSSGFQGSMTGKQNVKFVCRVYGKSAQEIKEITSLVREFADIGEYFEMPIRLYSSGMRARLSFGLSLAFDFDYLIIDETLSVGDANFKNKAKEALMKKIESSSVILVSHSMSDLRKICDVGILIHDGKMDYYEDVEDAIEAYHKINALSSKPQNAPSSSVIYCSDGNNFDNVTAAAIFYKIRPFSVLQALNVNGGSNVYLKQTFWRDGQSEPSFQEWRNVVKNETIISSDGVIFENSLEASLFYMEKVPNIEIDKTHVEELITVGNGFSTKLNTKFYYLSEYR